MPKILGYKTTIFAATVKKVLSTGVNPIKLFTAVIYGYLQSATVFVPGKPFQPSLMFAG